MTIHHNKLVTIFVSCAVLVIGVAYAWKLPRENGLASEAEISHPRVSSTPLQRRLSPERAAEIESRPKSQAQLEYGVQKHAYQNKAASLRAAVEGLERSEVIRLLSELRNIEQQTNPDVARASMSPRVFEALLVVGQPGRSEYEYWKARPTNHIREEYSSFHCCRLLFSDDEGDQSARWLYDKVFEESGYPNVPEFSTLSNLEKLQVGLLAVSFLEGTASDEWTEHFLNRIENGRFSTFRDLRLVQELKSQKRFGECLVILDRISSIPDEMVQDEIRLQRRDCEFGLMMQQRG